VLIISYGIYFNFEHQWVAEFSEFYGSQFNYIGSILVALGYIYLLAFIVQKDWIPRLTQRLAYVGRMAFTNYLSQSIICTIIFYHFELFGRVERWQQILIVLSIWLIQFVWSKWWLTRYRFGPLEWAWRSLSYWKVP